jgi:hypothetical protein
MKYVVMLLVLMASSAMGQSKVGAHLAGGDFDELFDVAPHCKDAAIAFMNYGTFQQAQLDVEACAKQVHDAIHAAGQRSKPIKDKQQKYVSFMLVKLIAREQDLLLDSMIIDSDSTLIGSGAALQP